MMIVALTGTPGTGKTSVSDHLKEEYRVIHLTQFLKENNLGEEKDSELEVETDEMVESLGQEINGGEDVLVEGHLSHYLPADYCVVLRCHPDTLKSRLQEREYSPGKIEENIESEALDQILLEAAEKHDEIIEIDTSGRAAEGVAEEISERIEEDETGHGEIDWSDWF